MFCSVYYKIKCNRQELERNNLLTLHCKDPGVDEELSDSCLNNAIRIQLWNVYGLFKWFVLLS